MLLQPDDRILRIASHDDHDENFITEHLSAGGGHAPVAAQRPVLFGAVIGTETSYV